MRTHLTTKKMLSAVTNTDIDIVNEALKLFLKMKIIEYTDDQTIFIPRVQELTCSTTEGAEKKDNRWKKGGRKVENRPP